MPKHIIEFTLPEEQEELAVTMKAMDMSIALSEFYNESLRKRLKYEDDSYSDKELKLLETIKKEFFEILNGRNKSEAPLIGEHTLTQAISLVSLAELDAKIFESVELSSSDIKFLNSVTESYAKKKASAKKRR